MRIKLQAWVADHVLVLKQEGNVWLQHMLKGEKPRPDSKETVGADDNGARAMRCYIRGLKLLFSQHQTETTPVDLEQEWGGYSCSSVSSTAVEVLEDGVEHDIYNIQSRGAWWPAEWTVLALALHLNAAMLCSRILPASTPLWAACKLHCDQALEIEPGSVKALYRRALACMGLGGDLGMAEASKSLHTALQLDPKNKQVKNELRKVRSVAKEKDRQQGK